MELNIIDLHGRTDVTSLNNALQPVVTALTALLPLLPFLILLKGAVLLGNVKHLIDAVHACFRYFSPHSEDMPGAGHPRAVFPMQTLLTPACAGLLLKDKLGALHGTPVYTQQLPRPSPGSYFNTRDHSELHDLVPARLVHHVAAPPSPYQRRVDTGLVGVGRVDRAVLEDHAAAQTQAKTYQQLMAELEAAGPRPRPHTASGGFWDSLLTLG